MCGIPVKRLLLNTSENVLKHLDRRLKNTGTIFMGVERLTLEFGYSDKMYKHRQGGFLCTMY